MNPHINITKNVIPNSLLTFQMFLDFGLVIKLVPKIRPNFNLI